MIDHVLHVWQQKLVIVQSNPRATLSNTHTHKTLLFVERRGCLESPSRSSAPRRRGQDVLPQHLALQDCEAPPAQQRRRPDSRGRSGAGPQRRKGWRSAESWVYVAARPLRLIGPATGKPNRHKHRRRQSRFGEIQARSANVVCFRPNFDSFRPTLSCLRPDLGCVRPYLAGFHQFSCVFDRSSVVHFRLISVGCKLVSKARLV